jgi:hypothetical protein
MAKKRGGRRSKYQHAVFFSDLGRRVRQQQSLSDEPSYDGWNEGERKRRPIGPILLVVVGVLVVSIVVAYAGKRVSEVGIVVGAAKTYHELQPPESVRQWTAIIPRKAEDIRFRAELGRSFQASFRVDEKDFLRWMQTQGWEPKSIEKSQSVDVVGKDGQLQPEAVEQGYFFEDAPDNKRAERPKSGRAVLFDSKRQTAHYHFWSA